MCYLFFCLWVAQTGLMVFHPVFVPAFHYGTDKKVTIMRAEHVNPFIHATISVLTKMAMLTAKPDKPYLKKDDRAYGDVSSIVGLTGVPTGSFSLSFEKQCVFKLVSNMFGEEINELSHITADAVGELANMISGQARQKLETIGFLCDGAIPTIARGEHHELRHITEGPKIAIPFTTDSGNFTLEVCFESLPEK